MRMSWACIGVVVLGTAGACTKHSNPAQPTEAAPVADASATASVTAPRPVSPAVGAQIRNVDQPVTLTVGNAVLTGNVTPTYTFEVATDTAFASKVYTKAGVVQGSSGQTSLTIDKLAPATDFYWRARAEGGGTVGPYSVSRKFTIGPAITINAVTTVEGPGNGAQTGSLVQFSVTNAVVSGPAGPLTYRFEVSTSNTFGAVVTSATVPQGVLRTTFNPTSEFPAETTLFWRVTVIDQTNGLTGPTSATFSFTTAFAIDLKKAVFLNSPDVSNWPRTASLTSVEQDGGGEGLMCFAYIDPGWPDSKWPYGGSDPNFGVYANQWYFLKINGVWYGGAGEWLYRGAASCKAGQGTQTMGPDSGFGSPFSTHQLRVGELVGYMVTSVARPGVTRTVDERSNIIVQPWRDSSLGSALVPFVSRR